MPVSPRQWLQGCTWWSRKNNCLKDKEAGLEDQAALSSMKQKMVTLKIVEQRRVAAGLPRKQGEVGMFAPPTRLYSGVTQAFLAESLRGRSSCPQSSCEFSLFTMSFSLNCLPATQLMLPYVE